MPLANSLSPQRRWRRSLLLMAALWLVLSTSCTATSALETGRVLPAGQHEQVIGLGMRFNIPGEHEEEDSWDWPSWSIRQLVLRNRFFHLDAFWLYRYGLEDGWNVEAGLKASLLTTFIRQAHAPGIILGARRALYDEDTRAAAAGLRWTGDIVLLGPRPANLILLSDLQMRVTASQDYTRGTAYVTPSAGHRWAWSRARDWRPQPGDDENTPIRWEYDRGAALIFGLGAGGYFEGDRLRFAAEGGAEFFPDQKRVEGPRMLPRFGFGLAW